MKKVDWKRKYEAEHARMLKERDKRRKAESKYEASQAEIKKERARRMRAERERTAFQIKFEGARRDARRLFKKVRELEKYLQIHDNPHTPPSQKKNGKKGKGKEKSKGKSKTKDKKFPDNEKAPSGRKPGGQKGHPGKTSKPKPTRFEEHTMSECPHCGSSHIHSIDQETRNITDLQPPPPPVTTRHTVHIYECSNCKAKDMMPETGLPSAGELGSRAIAEFGANYLDRLTHRMSAARMARMRLPVATGTVHNGLRRLGNNLAPQVAAILAVLINARVLHIDETSYRVNGETIWVWIFLDPVTGCTLYVLRDSRGRDVLDEILRGFRGTIVCDGWRPYRAWKIQRCWAHIIREAKYLTQMHPRSRAAQDILERLRRIYAIGCDARERRMSRARRVRLRATLLGHVTRILNDHHGNATAAPFLTKLEGAADDLFEFVLDPSVDPTNNAAERGLREVVIHRKLHTLRSTDSMDPMGNIFTCAVTWKNKGMDYVAELQKYA